MWISFTILSCRRWRSLLPTSFLIVSDVEKTGRDNGTALGPIIAIKLQLTSLPSPTATRGPQQGETLHGVTPRVWEDYWKLGGRFPEQAGTAIRPGVVQVRQRGRMSCPISSIRSVSDSVYLPRLKYSSAHRSPAAQFPECSPEC